MRRRLSVAYVLSILLHLLLVLFFGVRIVLPAAMSGGARVDEAQSETVTVSQQHVEKSERPLAHEPKRSVVKAPAPVAQPPLPPPPLAVRAHVAPQSAPRRPELSKIVPHAPVQAPSRIALIAPLHTAPPTAAPAAVPATVASIAPVASPVPSPSRPPTPEPTVPPTPVATPKPTLAPTAAATPLPTERPTPAPTARPTPAPTERPTPLPTARPTPVPTERPTPLATERATPLASAVPTAAPTRAPTARPTLRPTAAPTAAPTSAPSAAPTARPTSAGTPVPAPRGSPAPAARAASPGPGPANAGGPAAPKPEAHAPPAAPPAGASASAAPRFTTAPLSNGEVSRLNARLQGLLPSPQAVVYSQRHVTNDLQAAIDEAEAEYFKAAAPPPEVLAKALYVIQVKGSLLTAPSIMYVLKKQRILGFEICSGWYVIGHPLGGGQPVGGYSVGPCTGEKFTPSGGLPALPSPRPS